MDITHAFKLFDVRGSYPKVVDERLAYLIGLGILKLYRPKRVLLAADARPSSPELLSYLADGFTGAKISALGLASITQFYFAMSSSDFDLGVMVTASHIAASDNGFKFALKGALPFDEGQILDLKRQVQELSKENIVVPHPKIEKFDNCRQYLVAILDNFQNSKFASSVILDTSGSSVKAIVRQIFKKLSISFQEVENGGTGSPLLPENQEAVCQKILETKADLGIKWDSDGDRCIFFDRRARQIPTSYVSGFLARGEIAATGKKKIAVDIRSGLVTRDLVEDAGGELLVLPAWSQYLKFAMSQDPDIAFAAEASGHTIFSRFHRIDDGIFASLAFLALSQEPYFDNRLNALSSRYFELPEKNFPCTEETASLVLEKITQYYRDRGFPVSLVDGVTVFGKDWKFNLRPSLTEPLLRLNMEARNESEAAGTIEKIETLLESSL